MAPWKRALVVVAVVLAGLAAVLAARLALGEAPVRALRGHAAPVTAVAFAADSKALASGDNAGNVKLWDAETGAERAAFTLGEGAVTGLAFRPDGKLLAAAGHVALPKVWDVNTGKERPQPQLGGLAVAFAPDNKMLAVGGIPPESPTGRVGMVLLYDTLLNKEEHIRGHKGYMFRSLAFSRSGKVLVTGCANTSGEGHGEVGLWDGGTLQRIKTLEGDPRDVRSVAISSDGKRVVSAGEAAGVRVWDVEAGTVALELAAPLVRAVALSPDGKTVATAGGDQFVRLWDTATGKERKKWRAHGEGVEVVAFSPDGKRVVTGGGDRVVKLWAVGD